MRSKRVTPSRRESKGQLVLTKLKGQVRVPGQMTSKEEKERWGLGRINLSETKKSQPRASNSIGIVTLNYLNMLNFFFSCNFL